MPKRGIVQMIPSESSKARADAAVRFSKKHKWAVLPCLGAVCAVYSVEYIRQKAAAVSESLRGADEPCSRSPLGRAVSLMLSAAFAMMIIPVFDADVSASHIISDEEYLTEDSADELSDDAEIPESSSADEMPVVSEEKAPSEESRPHSGRNGGNVYLEGLAEHNADFGVDTDNLKISEDITVRFTSSSNDRKLINEAFDSYGIYTGDLCIEPVDVIAYRTETRDCVGLKEGRSASLTFSIPDEMQYGIDELRIVRLEDDGTMKVIEGDITEGENGSAITFSTDRFALFAMVSYSEAAAGTESEDMSSTAGMTADGVEATLDAVNLNPVFDRDRRRLVKGRSGKRIYRIKRVVKEKDLLL